MRSSITVAHHCYAIIFIQNMCQSRFLTRSSAITESGRVIEYFAKSLKLTQNHSK